MDSKTLVISTIFLLTVFTVRSQLHLPTLGNYLRSNGLPPALFPKAVSSYTIKSPRELHVVMQVGTCIVIQPPRNMLYEKTIIANISQGKLEDVQGIFVRQALRAYIPVTKIELSPIVNTVKVQFDHDSVNLPIGMATLPLACSCSAAVSGKERKHSVAVAEV